MKSLTTPLLSYQDKGVALHSATAMPLASAFLWNPMMMLQANCRGYVTAQFMQPEPAKYAHAPNLEAKTFMQPEQPYFAHHPGRFFYVKDLEKDILFSAPYEPVRANGEEFKFVAEQDCIWWKIVNNGIEVRVTVRLAADRPLELWEAKVTNLSKQSRKLSFTPYFPVGYMSWMNQSASFNAELNAIICRSITPYQKYPDYFKNKDLKDLTFLIADEQPDSFETRQSSFEGEGGLHAPSSLERDSLGDSDAIYETPTAAMQYHMELAPQQSDSYRFAFGPAKDTAEIAQIQDELFSTTEAFKTSILAYKDYIARGKSKLEVSTPDAEFDHYVNHWLARQVFYHGDVNRLSTDPQTRNYLQDNMGMAYVMPGLAREAFLHALSQQNSSGAMPDGILLNDQAELKYINQVPHMDHCVWLPVCLSAYLDETNDYAILDKRVAFADSDQPASVFEHISRALQWLYQQRDHRGLNYIQQGDWCDPMNMVGYKGKGVSGWLTLGTAYACKLWAQICHAYGHTERAQVFIDMQTSCNDAVNKHIWHGQWYGRGITDDDVLFGIDTDPEGKIFLNPQAWAILSDAASDKQAQSAIAAVEENLATPYGVQMLAPAYTKMRDDIGRVTQKYPGSAENGSVYNHAAAFYVYALYQGKHQGQHADQAYIALKQMLPNKDHDDLVQRGQLPVFIPNYYRGAYQEYPRTAGRSSQLFNTGTVHWFYRCLIDGLFGVQGCPDGLRIRPQLPSQWPGASLKREFRDAQFEIEIQRGNVTATQLEVDGVINSDGIIRNITAGQNYRVKVTVPQV